MIPIRNFNRNLQKTFRQPFYAGKVLYRRTVSYLIYLWGQGYSLPPESITFFLTHRCNLRCQMCGQWGESGVTRSLAADTVRQELNLPELKLFIDRVAKFQPNITLFGGEPLLYSDYIPLLEYIKSKKLHCLTITNGSLLGKYADQIVNVGLDELNLSLDGDNEIHDKIRGLPGLFSRIQTGILSVQESKQKLNVTRPLINLQCTITPYNYLFLERMIKVATEFGADSLTFHHLIYLDENTYHLHNEMFQQTFACSSPEWEGFITDLAKQIVSDKLTAKIKEIRNISTLIPVDFYPNFTEREIKKYYTQPDFVPQGYAHRCLSPWLVGYLFPNGDLRPCLNSEFAYGNILQTTEFNAIWNSPLAIKYRRVLKQNGIFPVCPRCTEFYRY